MLVTCGSREGQLHLSKLMKGEDCILTETRWVSCSGFEVLGGKGKAKKWRSSIRAKNIPLGQLFQELTEQSPKPAHSKRGTSHSHSQRAASPPAKRRATKSPADKGSPQTSSASECEMKPVCQSMKQWSSEESAAEEEGADGKALQTCKILLVKCGCVEGKLYKSRFANAIRGKCIRTPQRWYTPLEFLREGRLQADDQSWGHCIVHGHWTLNRLIRMGVLESHSEDCMCFICIPSSQMNNDDECLPCGQGGELLLCDMCPHSFHNDCHIPPVSKECLSARWICTLCEHSKIPRPLHVTHHMSEVLLCSTKEHLLRCQYLLLRLYCEDKNNTFINNPRHLERYCSVISRPMWLAQMRENLLRNRYQTVGQFVGDVRLIFQNCTKYNKSDKRFLALGKQLKEFFEKEFSSVFGT
ncbi:nuclear body protein SP140-like protein [Amia ocellicauda]|uniref:nuclear body protein SP140-like protein n=1 Tax=Amia ocellicauda TaxID=2972642 RepID=UPI003464C352